MPRSSRRRASAGDAILEIDTPAGKAAIRLQDVDFGTPRNYLDGKIVAQRLPSATRFAAAPSDNDYPAAARGRDGAVWVAYVAYQRGGEPDMAAAARGDFRTFVPTGNGDQIRLVKFDGQRVVRADARHRTAAGSLEADRDGRRGRPRVDRLEPERRRQLGHLPPQLRSGPEPVVADRARHFRPGLRYQRRLHDRLEGKRLVGMAGPPREAFSNLPHRRRCRQASRSP